MPRKLTTEEFIERARKVHGDKYNYSKVEYQNNNTKVMIICPEHGEFKQRSSDHLRGVGCPNCAGNNRKTTKEFLERARKVHGDKYNYSKVEYDNMKNKVTIICPEHGEFKQYAGSHLGKQGCPECAKNITRGTTTIFIKRAGKIHSDKYDYSKVEYNNSYTPVTIICSEHGEFQQRPNVHLKGSGCPTCTGNKKLTTNEFIERAKEIHGDKYDYSKVEYKNSYTPVTIICPEHGEFQQRPRTHLDNHGCLKCNFSGKHITNASDLNEKFLESNFLNKDGEIKMQEMMQYFNAKETVCYRYMRNLGININYRIGDSGFNPKEPATLYYIYDPETNLYKIGITNRSVEERFGKGFCSNRALAILEQTYYEDGYKALEAESEILEAFSYARTINESWPEELGGKTEFFDRDILHKHREFKNENQE